MADNFIEGLLGNPLLNLGVGLLSASGPSLQPKGLGQVLGQGAQFMSQRQAQQMQLQAVRERLERQKQQSQARAQLPSAMSSQGVMKPGAVQGLLSQAYPEQYGQAMVQGLLNPQTPRLSTDMNDFIASGGNPQDQEAFMRFKAANDPAAAMQAQLLALQIQSEQNEVDEQDREATTAQITLKRNTNNDLRSLSKLAEANEILAPTFLATGGVLPETRRDMLSVLDDIGGLFGQDSPERQATIDAWDTFSKESQRLANSISNSYSGVTNARYQGVIDAIPNLGLNPQANRGVISAMVSDLLGGASDLGISVENPRQYSGLIDLGHAPAPAVTPPANPIPPLPPGFVLDGGPQ